MIIALSLALAQSTAATTGPILEPLPRPVEAAASAYEHCLMGVIDAQDSRGAYSERAVLSACAGVRRAKYGEAIAGLNGAGRPAGFSRGRVRHRFAELDAMVWTIVGHVRERHGPGRSAG